MAQHDVTVLGPYTFGAADKATMDTALTALSAGAAAHKLVSVSDGNQYYLIFVEGA